MASYTAFADARRIAAGPLDVVVAAAKAAFDQSRTSRLLIFDDDSGEQIDVDYSGAVAEVVRSVAVRLRLAAAAATSTPSFPLQLEGREVALLPRHWQWLNGQPGGASAALRRLVDDARRTSAGRDRVRHAQNATYRVMVALAGDLPGFEETIRALFAGDVSLFATWMREWPEDVRDYVRSLAGEAFSGG